MGVFWEREAFPTRYKKQFGDGSDMMWPGTMVSRLTKAARENAGERRVPWPSYSGLACVVTPMQAHLVHTAAP